MRIITGKHLARRTFLRGIGAAIALPMLDSMRPALAANSAAPVRIAFAYIPNGVILKDWKPAAEGRAYEFTRILKPLEPHRDVFSVLSGLDQRNANALGDGGGDHARAGACFLTGVHPKKTSGSDIHAGISADQIAALEIGKRTRFPSLELGCDDSRVVGGCDSGYSCAYTNSISWRTPTTPMPPEINPRVVFERLFGSEDLSLDPETRARRAANRRSVLDLVQDDTSQLTGKLGTADRRKIDEYLTAVREIEKRIESAETDNRQIDPGLDKPSGIPTTFDDYLGLMFDLQLAAFRTDLTRISTIVLGREGSRRVYPEIGVADPHHPLSHHRNQEEPIEKLTKINTFHVQILAGYLAKLKTTQDGDGTLLDHTLFVYGSAISDGNRHTHEDLPVLLAGRGNGSVKPGRHIVFPTGTPLTNLYMTMLDRAGVHPEYIGDSNGKLEGLDV
jgi:uncharacterized protein DUF1552